MPAASRRGAERGQAEPATKSGHVGHLDLDGARIDRLALVVHDHLGKGDGQPDHDDLDADERHRSPIDLAGRHRSDLLAGDLVDVGHARRDRAEIEQRKAERRMHEAGLHVDAEKHAEPDQVDAEFVRCGRQQRHDDEGQFEEIEEEGEEEHQNVHDDQEADFAAWQRHQQVLDPQVTVDAVERQREHACADQDEQDEARKPCGGGQRLANDIEVQPPLGGGHDKGADRTHRASLGWRRDAKKNGAENEEDQRQRRDQHDNDLLGQSRHHAELEIPVEEGGHDR